MHSTRIYILIYKCNTVAYFLDLFEELFQRDFFPFVKHPSEQFCCWYWPYENSKLAEQLTICVIPNRNLKSVKICLCNMEQHMYIIIESYMALSFVNLCSFESAYGLYDVP